MALIRGDFLPAGVSSEVVVIDSVPRILIDIISDAI